MSEHLDAETTRSDLLWQDDYLAPLAIPTGQPPADVLNVIWGKVRSACLPRMYMSV